MNARTLFRPTRLAATVAVMMAAGLLAAPATASASAPDSTVASASMVAASPTGAGAPLVTDLTTGPVTSTETRDPAFVGLDTTRFEIKTTTPSGGKAVHCDYTYFFGASESATFTAAQWDSGSVTLPIPEDTVELAFYGTSYTVDCGPDDDSFTVEWPLSTVVSTGVTSVLYEGGNPSPMTFRLFDRYDYDNPLTVHPLDVVRITGAPGTWPVATGATSRMKDLTLSTSSSSREEALPIDEFSISPNGAVLTMTLPADLSSVADNPFLPGTPAIDTFTVHLYSDYGAGNGGQVETIWTTAVSISTEVVSRSTVALSSPWGLSFLRTRATATITVPGTATPTGTVSVLVDGRKAGTVTLRAADHGAARILLPYLPRGRHSVSMVYSGAAGVLGSTSSPAALRVFF